MKQLSKISLAVFIIIVTVITVDYTFGIVADKLLLNPKVSKFEYYMNDNSNPDIVFFGPSTAENNYDTPYIKDSIDIFAINLGEPGRGLTYHEAVISSYLRDHRPKLIVLDLLTSDLSGIINNRIKPLYRYVDLYPEISEVAEKVDGYNKYYLWSHLLRYNSEIVGCIKSIRHPYDCSTAGFVALPKRSNMGDLKEKVIERADSDIDPIAYNSLISIIKLCRKNKIDIIVAHSPENYIRKYKLPITKICDSLDVRLIDSRYFRCPGAPADYFYDDRHLNQYGAREYTKHFMEILCDSTEFTKSISN